MQNRDYSAKRAADLVGNTTNAQLFQTALSPVKDVQVFVPAGAKAFRVRAGGTATGGTTTNFTPTIYWGDATTTALAAHAATAYNSASGGWLLEAEVHFDSVNSLLHGWKWGYVGTTPTVLANTILTDVSSVTTVDGQPIAIGCTFSAANAGNKATLDFFAIEVLESAK